MALRFFRDGFGSTSSAASPSRQEFEYVQERDAGAADRLKRLQHKVFKKKRTTVTLSCFIHVQQAPLIQELDQEEQEKEEQRNSGNGPNNEIMSPTALIKKFLRGGSSSSSASSSSPFANRQQNSSSAFSSSGMNVFSGGFNSSSGQDLLAGVSATQASSSSLSSSSSPSSGSGAMNRKSTTANFEQQQRSIASSPVAGTRFVKTQTGEAKIAMFCTVPVTATCAEIITAIEADLKQYHKRAFLHPAPEYYCLHPTLESPGAPLDRSKKPLSGNLAPAIYALGNFPYPPVSVVPNIFAVNRTTLESKSEPEKRVVIYHQRLLFVQHNTRVAKLMNEMANLAHSTSATQKEDWKQLRNQEVEQRTGIRFSHLCDDERCLRHDEIELESDVMQETMFAFFSLVNQFYDDCCFEFRRALGARSTINIVMLRERADIVQRVGCRERFGQLVNFVDELYSQYQLKVRHALIESRLAFEIVSTANTDRNLHLGATVHAASELKTMRRKNIRDARRTLEDSEEEEKDFKKNVMMVKQKEVEEQAVEVDLDEEQMERARKLAAEAEVSETRKRATMSLILRKKKEKSRLVPEIADHAFLSGECWSATMDYIEKD